MSNVKRWLYHDVLYPQWLIVCVLLTATDTVMASCSYKQAEVCREAIQQKSLSSLSSAGECTPSPYANEFTHACRVVSYYRPITDHCCCPHKGAALCCLYHQDAAYFRCHEVKDAIGVGSLDDSVPLKILLPVVIIPIIVLVLICIPLCIRCGRSTFQKICLASDDEDDSVGAEKCQLSSALRGWLDGRDDLRPAVRSTASRSSASPALRSSYGKLPTTTTSESTMTEPTAPPLEFEDDPLAAADSSCVFMPAEYRAIADARDRTCSDPSSRFHPPPGLGTGRSISVPANAIIHNGAVITQHTCPSCSSIIAPPPAYDDDRHGLPPAYEMPSATCQMPSDGRHNASREFV